MVPTSWRVREGGGAMALMPWCYAARHGLVRLVGRLPLGTRALSDTAALGDREISVVRLLSGCVEMAVPECCSGARARSERLLTL